MARSTGPNGFDYISKIKELSEGVAFVARSLGLAAYVRPCQKTCQTGNGGTYYRVMISGNTSIIPVRIPRKATFPRKQKRNVLRTRISVRPAGLGEYFGFELNKDGLFLLGDFTVTHNTLTVEMLAESLFGTKMALRKVDCEEFQHSQEVARLIGSPPGYIGHRETKPYFTQETLEEFHTEKLKLAIILFDEIEKASDALWNLLLGILDRATLTLGDGRKVDFTKTIIILTGNTGARELQHLVQGGMGFSGSAVRTEDDLDKDVDKTAVEAARKKFSPEFMNRIDRIVVFHGLRPDHLKRVVELELQQVQARVLRMSGQKEFVLSYTEEAKSLLLDRGTDAKNGARPLKRIIENLVVNPLASLLSTSQIRFGDLITVDEEGGGLTFTRKEEGVLAKEAASD